MLGDIIAKLMWYVSVSFLVNSTAGIIILWVFTFGDLTIGFLAHAYLCLQYMSNQ